METLAITLTLLVMFQIKHYLIDFVIQLNDPNSMRKFDATGWFIPLLNHASHHAFGTLAIALMTFLHFEVLTVTLFGIALLLALGDLVIHFIMDRIKASPNMLGRYKFPMPGFFYSLGLDQSVHHLTHYAIIGILVYVLIT